jgi:hypothetical protein
MTARPIPRRYWRRHGTGPLPTGKQALDEPFAAFPSWFLRVECERCGQERLFNEAHAAAQRHMALRKSLPACATTAAAVARERRNSVAASRAPAAGRFGGSC